MAAWDAPTTRLERAKKRVETADVSDRDREAIVESIGEDLAATTEQSYLRKLAVLAEECDGDLVDLEAAELDELISELGEARSWSPSTFKIYQSAAKNLVGEVGADDGAISMAKQDRSPVDERDVLEPDEFHDVREAATSARDRALIDLLGYTGQRIGMIQQLRIRDVDLEERCWYVPETDEGLKGADEVGNKRPLLGALRAVGDYIDVHPTGDPDDYLITPATSAQNAQAGDMISGTSMRRSVRNVVRAAGIDKPAHPHMFRHYFVTVAKTRYGLDEETVKALIGHSAASDVFQTTYRHLSDEDHIEAAERAFGIRDEEDDHVAPPVCASCQRPLRPSAKTCPTAGCSERFVAPESPVEEIAVLEREIEEKFERFEELRAQL